MAERLASELQLQDRRMPRKVIAEIGLEIEANYLP
jgi:hypothetical protein